MRSWRIPYPKFGNGPGLERVARLASALGIDLARFGTAGAVILGSNGKGSTAAMTGALLEQTGQPVGLFTSPHMLDLNERFRLDGEDIGDEELERHWARVEAAIEKAGLAQEVGGFEFLFLIAADWFAARKCAYTVWEAGLGGRLDPVRLIEARQLALTSLDLEHTALLGETLEEIAREKIDAAPKGATLFVAQSCAPTFAAIEARCAERGVVPKLVPPLQTDAPLAGAHQNENAALALALARALAPISDGAVENGFAATRWPGRLEVLAPEPLVVIDVGHTPAGVRAALAGFGQMRGVREAVLVCGASGDKDFAAIIDALAPSFSTIICAAAHHKGAPAVEIAAAALAANTAAEVVTADSVADARRIALARTGNAGAIYVAGGLFLAAEFKAAHLGRDPATLLFF